MLSRILRPTMIALLILLPVVIFWALLPYFDATRITAEASRTAPRWVEDGRRYATCSEAMGGTPVSNQVVDIDESRAARIGAGVIERETNLHTITGKDIVVFKPSLVRRQFPDGQLRLAWVYGQGRVTDNYGMSARAAFVYIDATTGEPLLLIKDMFAGDPSFTCSQVMFDFEAWLQPFRLQSIGAAVTGLYFLMIGIAALILRRRRRAAEQTNLV